MNKHDRGIIILTAGMRHYPERWKADIDANIRLRAGIELYREYHKQGQSPLIIITGGHTFGKDSPDLASVLAGKAMRIYHIPEKDLALETESVDTSENAEFSRPIIERERLTKLDLITSAWHLPRAKMCFDRYKIKTSPKSAEEILRNSSKSLRKMIEKIESSPASRGAYVREWIYRGLMRAVGPIPFREYIHWKINTFGKR